MEEFGYKKSFKVSKFMGAGYPMILLLGLLAYQMIGYWLFEVENPSSLVRFKFNWWVPVVALGLIGWAIFEIKRGREVSNFKVRLSEDAIQVDNERIHWRDICKVEFKTTLGQERAAILHATNGHVLTIPVAIEGYAYIKGVIERHRAEMHAA